MDPMGYDSIHSIVIPSCFPALECFFLFFYIVDDIFPFQFWRNNSSSELGIHRKPSDGHPPQASAVSAIVPLQETTLGLWNADQRLCLPGLPQLVFVSETHRNISKPWSWPNCHNFWAKKKGVVAGKSSPNMAETVCHDRPQHPAPWGPWKLEPKKSSTRIATVEWTVSSLAVALDIHRFGIQTWKKGPRNI